MYTELPEDFSNNFLNANSNEFIADPYAYYRQLRAVAPFVQLKPGMWAATSYATVSAVLKSDTFGKGGGLLQIYGEAGKQHPCLQLQHDWLLAKNPPIHKAQRELLVKAFSAKRIEQLKSSVQKIIDQLIANNFQHKNVDILADFAFPLAAFVICDILGIPEESRQQLLEDAKFQIRLVDPKPLSATELQQTDIEVLKLREHFKYFCNLRKQEPQDDLISELIQCLADDPVMSAEELLANLFLIFFAGHLTTVNAIGNGLYALFQQPQQLELLRKDPSFIYTAVEELLRYDTSGQIAYYTSLNDQQLFGQSIKAGDCVMCVLGAANRDPERYSDPEHLNLTRTKVRPISFGAGIHYCLGAQLGKLEIAMALEALLTRFPNIQLAETPSWRNSISIRGLEELIVTL